ncbi:MAG TPA: trypsin-like peptidase domain-containing protein [Candidatus Mediterraneibacter intestinigallinarum]|nr:trypsin-like peptidase domain-containing protein [Candidatus Mediterraneibacter intestinigallinarum]
MSEQFFDNNDNKNNEYHFTGDQLNQTVINDTPPTGGPDSGTPNHESRKPKTKKPMTMGKKWAVVVSMALVFGLIAGGTMFGVNTVGNLITGAGRSNVQLAQTSTTSSSGTSSSSDSGSGTVTEVAANAMPSLVTISTMTVEEMQNFFGGTQQYEVEGAGTGVIVGENDTELLIATNYHVVEGANSLSVGFIDETSVEAEIKGTDVNNDLAVVAVKLSDIPDDTMNQIKIATIGDSDELQLGDQVVAIGNALGYGQSVTSGYVSALDRDLTLEDANGTTITSTGLIQTDAAINSGNSGGALLNMRGELVGINEAKSSSSSSGASVDNIGFAIPINKAQDSLQEMMNQETRERVDESEASYIGIQGQDVSTQISELYGIPSGVVIAEVVQGSPADQAGLERGDILTALDGRNITSMTQLQDVLQYYAAGETVDLTIQRSGENGYEEQTLSITLGSAQDAQ